MQQQGTAFLGVGINYPLPLLNRNEGERQKARLSREQARTDLERLERQISAEVSIAFESYRTAQQALAQARTVLTKASDVLATVQLAYLKGATPIVDLLEAQRSWYETEQSYYDALAEYWRSVVGLLGGKRPIVEPCGGIIHAFSTDCSTGVRAASRLLFQRPHRQWAATSSPSDTAGPNRKRYAAGDVP